MVYYPNYKSWEIMDCDNLDCPARCEAKIPCWEIARRVEAYHNVSNTCRDCIGLSHIREVAERATAALIEQ
jgi:hypothetical protein